MIFGLGVIMYLGNIVLKQIEYVIYIVAQRTTKRGIVLSQRVKGRVNDKLKTLVKQKKVAKFKQGGKSVYQER